MIVDYTDLIISFSISFTDLFAFIVVHLPIEAKESALCLVRLNSSKLSNISRLLHSCRILLKFLLGNVEKKHEV